MEPKQQLEKITTLVNDFQSDAWESGWYAGSIEHGAAGLVAKQVEAIQKRCYAKERLLAEISEALGITQ